MGNRLHLVISVAAFIFVMNATAQVTLEKAINYNAPYSEIKALNDDAANQKYIHVLVDPRVENSIQAITNNPISDLKKEQDQLLADLDGDYIKGTEWRGMFGQLTIYVTQSGFQKLLKNPLVRDVQRAPEKENIYDPYQDIKRIEEEIHRHGSAMISVIINNGMSQAKKSIAGYFASLDPEDRKKQFLNDLHGENFIDIDANRNRTGSNEKSGESSSSINLTAKIEGLYELRNRSDIRSMRLINKEWGKLTSDMEVKSAFLDPLAIKEAKEKGSALIIIHLRRYPGYTPITSSLTPKELEKQNQYIKQTFTEVVERVAPGSAENLEFIDGIASAMIRLKLDSLIKLYENPDPRIERVNANRPEGTSALRVSTANGPGGTNAQYIWKYTRGGGQWVAIIDSGVQTTHPMFQNKFFRQACFGTDNSTHQSTCPSKNADGDTPLLQENIAGAACGYVAHPTPNFSSGHVCAHGTHVAGIAAGRGGNHPTEGILNGIAVDANIISVNTFSRELGIR